MENEELEEMEDAEETEQKEKAKTIELDFALDPAERIKIEIAKTETIKVSAINEFNARYIFNRFHPKAKIICVSEKGEQ